MSREYPCVYYDDMKCKKFEEPGSDVVEVKRGRWISLTECANEGVYCSVCHKKVYRADYAWCNKKNKVRSNFCPNCGADMREVREE